MAKLLADPLSVPRNSSPASPCRGARVAKRVVAVLVVAGITAGVGCADEAAPRPDQIPDQGMTRQAAEQVWRTHVEPPAAPITNWACDPSFDRCWMIINRPAWQMMDSTQKHRLVGDVGPAAAVLHAAHDTDFIDIDLEEDLATYSARHRRVRVLQ